MKLPYAELASKHGLPNVNQWLQLEDLVQLSDIRKGFQEKLFSFADFLNMLLRPEDVTSVAEAQVFSDEEMQKVESLYRELMLIGKDCQLVEIESSEETELQMVRRLIAAWPSIAERMKAVVEKTKGAYADNEQRSHHISYLG